MKVYARWREKHLETRPKWTLPLPAEPIITLGSKGEAIKNKGIWVVLALLAFLALSRDSK